jgi:hypothetical protein
MPGYDQPVSGQVISLPEHQPIFNLLYLRKGRLPKLGDRGL